MFQVVRVPITNPERNAGAEMLGVDQTGRKCLDPLKTLHDIPRTHDTYH